MPNNVKSLILKETCGEKYCDKTKCSTVSANEAKGGAETARAGQIEQKLWKKNERGPRTKEKQRNPEPGEGRPKSIRKAGQEKTVDKENITLVRYSKLTKWKIKRGGRDTMRGGGVIVGGKH